MREDVPARSVLDLAEVNLWRSSCFGVTTSGIHAKNVEGAVKPRTRYFIQ